MAQPEQEPVAIVHVRPLMGNESIPQTRIEWKSGRPVAGPLYTTPPQRTWVGLEQEIAIAVLEHCYPPMVVSSDMIERTTEVIKAKLKEKNT